jgi:hypothetical protein
MAFTAARLNAAVDAALSTSTHIQAHTGAPGGSGTSNVATNCARVALAGVGSASGGIDSITAALVFTGSSGGPVTHFSLWTAITAGTFNGDGTLTPNESFAGAGTLNVTIPVTGT